MNVNGVEVSDVRPFAEDLVGMAQLFQGVHTANGTPVRALEEEVIFFFAKFETSSPFLVMTRI